MTIDTKNKERKREKERRFVLLIHGRFRFVDVIHNKNVMKFIQSDYSVRCPSNRFSKVKSDTWYPDQKYTAKYHTLNWKIVKPTRELKWLNNNLKNRHRHKQKQYGIRLKTTFILTSNLLKLGSRISKKLLSTSSSAHLPVLMAFSSKDSGSIALASKRNCTSAITLPFLPAIKKTPTNINKSQDKIHY